MVYGSHGIVWPGGHLMLYGMACGHRMVYGYSLVGKALGLA